MERFTDGDVWYRERLRFKHWGVVLPEWTSRRFQHPFTKPTDPKTIKTAIWTSVNSKFTPTVSTIFSMHLASPYADIFAFYFHIDCQMVLSPHVQYTQYLWIAALGTTPKPSERAEPAPPSRSSTGSPPVEAFCSYSRWTDGATKHRWSCSASVRPMQENTD